MSRNHEPLLRVQDLAVHFRGEETLARAVDGVSFDVCRGETVCLVGESGCGKTVSALAILGLVPCPPGRIAGGKILLEGENLLEMEEEALRMVRGKRVAMVFQEPLTSLNPVFTIGDQIAEAIRAHEDVSKEEVRQRTIRLLEDVGIPSAVERYGAYPHELSGGQRQRVMIAMALACGPDLLIADEPTTALDVTVQAQILRLVKGLQASRDLSALYITHDLGVVAHIADRVYVMYAGLIVEQGDRFQIFKEPKHPYTTGLLASLPDRKRKGTPLAGIPGTVPDPARKPPGCPFHPRCGHAVPACGEALPDFFDYGQGHLARCPVIYEAQGAPVSDTGKGGT
ncbi:MAG: ABC transporter ATP-binding protein [Deltaproteobacteria bacterium]|nr:ABC transporter ATP-binding protein [Deltaproteobacteria bacterium]MBW1923208.1 ABC transporter ATP-binding protein [Deltaproteobacteria bacterium]MBW1948293.1 ABC transporter ATP-binding protein [Deltaproteobacteria bacterium]MBW2006790.1 ABC transporter ATP-binding protein [Deltaproteobacteria bacterium]MBW2347793.1 ABC transporter ATP-binding protein [Deltaproteobacteria bacterium]